MEATLDAVTQIPAPRNEPVHSYAPGSPERVALEGRLKELAAEPVELTMTIGGEHRPGGGEPVEVIQPHRKDAVLGRLGNATVQDARAALAAAKAAASAWRRLPFEERAAILLSAADLLAGPWRQTLNAATMLGQSKTAYQAEIDSACELVDFWRYNVAYAGQILREQPLSPAGVWNRMDHRPLEGFVLAITPSRSGCGSGQLSPRSRFS
jgi:1-pyrroline-5-carboxylate dehydrogenase